MSGISETSQKMLKSFFSPFHHVRTQKEAAVFAVLQHYGFDMFCLLVPYAAVMRGAGLLEDGS